MNYLLAFTGSDEELNEYLSKIEDFSEEGTSLDRKLRASVDKITVDAVE